MRKMLDSSGPDSHTKVENSPPKTSRISFPSTRLPHSPSVQASPRSAREFTLSSSPLTSSDDDNVDQLAESIWDEHHAEEVRKEASVGQTRSVAGQRIPSLEPAVPGYEASQDNMAHNPSPAAVAGVAKVCPWELNRQKTK